MTLVDGTPADAIVVSDRGLQYGDGLFETIAVVDGRPCLWDRHVERLRAGCERLAIPMPPEHQLAEEAQRLARGVDRAVLKLILTRGEGGRGYRPPDSPRPRRIVRLTPYCETRLGHQPLLAGLKHLNRLEQVLARAEWSDPDVAEGLMLDLDGRVVEGTQTNLFALLEGRLVTPPLNRCGVAGVVREVAIASAAAVGLEVVESVLLPEQVAAADGLFLTSSLAGIWPIRELAGRPMDPKGIPEELRTGILEAAFRP